MATNLVSKNLARLIEESKRKEEDISELSHVTNLNKVKNGRDCVSVAVLQRLAEVFQKPVSLFFNEGNRRCPIVIRFVQHRLGPDLTKELTEKFGFEFLLRLFDESKLFIDVSMDQVLLEGRTPLNFKNDIAHLLYTDEDTEET